MTQTTVSTTGAVGVRWRLGQRTRKTVLLVHIASAGAWLGIDVTMAVLIFTAMLTGDDQLKAACLRILRLVTVEPLLVAGLVCLASGLVLGLASKYGLVRFWWVLVKLVLNLILTSLVLVALGPEVTSQASLAERFLAGQPLHLPVGNLIFPPIVSPTAVMVAMVLSVFKPWGRVRKP
jgi:uncharacterized membrane protein